MKKIHLNRDRQNLGEFSEEEVLAGLAEGKFLPTDLAWHVGMDAWRPIGEIQASLSAGSASPPTPEPLSETASGLESRVAPGDHSAVLPHDPQPAWERRQSLGFFPAIVESIRQILTQPAQTFSQMPREGGFGSPLIFSILLSWAGIIAASIYQGIWFMVNPSALERELEGISLGLFWAILAGVLIIMPIFITILAFIGSAITHLCLMITGGAKHSYETTFRVTAYCQGATGILQFIPFCGGLLYSIWYLVALIIGLTKAHETETWRVVVAVLLPVLLCCGLFAGLMGLAGAAAFGEALGGK
jgi:hypothetical protein